MCRSIILLSRIKSRKEFLVENLSVSSITSQRRVQFLDKLNSNQHVIVIDNGLTKSCMSAKAKYREHFKQKEKEKIMKWIKRWKIY